MKAKVKLFDIYIFLVTLCKGFGAESSNILYIVAFAVGCSAIFAKISREKFFRREIFSMLAILGVGILDFIIGHTTTILFTAVAICGLKNCDIDHLIKISFWTRLGAFITLVSLSIMGVIQNSTLRFWRNGEVLTRYSFGYSHPNIAQASLIIIIIIGLYLYSDKFQWYHYVILLGIDYVFYRFTFSRTGFIVGIVCIFLNIVSRKAFWRKLTMQTLKYSYWIFFVGTLAIGILYGNVTILRKIDLLLTGRIQYINILLRNAFPPLIGSAKYNAIANIDNGYIALLYEGGIIAFVWFTYYIVKCYKKAYKECDSKRYFLLFDFFLYAVTESFFPSIAVNISLLFIGEILFETRLIEEKQCEKTYNIYTNL